MPKQMINNTVSKKTSISYNKENLLVSVIIPIYKVDVFLKKCVDSVLNQTYNNIEVILVDDGSPDTCPEICDEYAKQDSRVRVIHKCNGGQSSARNAGINIAKGDYITFVDSDDWIDPNAYKNLVSSAVENNLDIVGGGYCYYRPWKIENKILGA